MFIVSALQGAMGLVRAALASILLVWVPIADAATCAGDKAPSSVEYNLSAGQLGAEQASSDVSSPSDGTSMPIDAQHCVHGHCHQPLAPQSSQAATIIEPRVTDVTTYETIVLVSYVTTGLERPPKA